MQSRILEITTIRSNGKCYACKSCLNKIDDENCRLTIVKIEEVSNIEGNSFTKLKVIFDCEDEKFNRVKYRDILSELSKILGKKHRIKNFILSA